MLSKRDFDSFRISSIKTMAVEMYRILKGMGPEYLSTLFSKSNVQYQLSDGDKLIRPLKRTTTFVIKYLAYFGTNLSNMLSRSYKIKTTRYTYGTLYPWKVNGQVLLVTVGCASWSFDIILCLCFIAVLSFTILRHYICLLSKLKSTLYMYISYYHYIR